MGYYVDGEWVRDEAKYAKNLEARKGGWTSDTGARFRAAGMVKDILPSDVYVFRDTESGRFFEKRQFPSDDVAYLPGLPCDYIVNQINEFWKKGAIYQKYGMVHKRGILLYGPPGCGKTSIVKLLCNDLIKKNGVIFSISDFRDAENFVADFRRVEPDRPILTIQEDIEGLFEGKEGAEQIKAALSFLDGQAQVNNIVHIATTNQPESLADRFIKRPGRFDLVIGLHEPTAETREAYLKYIFKNMVSESDLKKLVDETSGLGLAYLREVAATYLCLEIPIAETLKRLHSNKKMKSLKVDDKKLGFTIGYDE